MLTSVKRAAIRLEMQLMPISHGYLLVIINDSRLRGTTIPNLSSHRIIFSELIDLHVAGKRGDLFESFIFHYQPQKNQPLLPLTGYLVRVLRAPLSYEIYNPFPLGERAFILGNVINVRLSLTRVAVSLSRN